MITEFTCPECMSSQDVTLDDDQMEDGKTYLFRCVNCKTLLEFTLIEITEWALVDAQPRVG